MGTERGGCSRLMKTPRHNGGAVHSRSIKAKKKGRLLQQVSDKTGGKKNGGRKIRGGK